MKVYDDTSRIPSEVAGERTVEEEREREGQREAKK